MIICLYVKTIWCKKIVSNKQNQILRGVWQWVVTLTCIWKPQGKFSEILQDKLTARNLKLSRYIPHQDLARNRWWMTFNYFSWSHFKFCVTSVWWIAGFIQCLKTNPTPSEDIGWLSLRTFLMTSPIYWYSTTQHKL